VLVSSAARQSSQQLILARAGQRRWILSPSSSPLNSEDGPRKPTSSISRRRRDTHCSDAPHPFTASIEAAATPYIQVLNPRSTGRRELR
jgi:hypothetical protein